MTAKIAGASEVMVRLSDLTSEPKRMLPPIKGFEEQPLVSLEKSVQPLLSFVPDVEQMVWTVKQNCEKPEDDLTPDESGSIMLYTLEWEPSQSSFYRILNTALRSANRQELRPWFLYLRLIIYALAKLPSLSCRTIYRGVQIDISKDFIKDKIFIWWAFSSCTSTIDVIKDFLGNNGSRTIINIECDSAKDISRHSFYQKENEILLYPARQLKVISSLDTGNRLHIVQLKEISPPFPLIHIPQITSTPSTTIIYPRSRQANTKKQDDVVTIGVHDLVLNEKCPVFDDENSEKIFVSVEFLNYPAEELETPLSLVKGKPNKKYSFNFQKDLPMRDQKKKQQLAELVGPQSSGEYVIRYTSNNDILLFYFRIKFVVVAEPPENCQRSLNCVDIGYATVNAKQLLRDQEDYVEKSINGKTKFHFFFLI
jgi:hypothetical protein